MLDFNEFQRIAELYFPLSERSDHGPKHWKQVEENFKLISYTQPIFGLRPFTDEEMLIGKLFSIFHDCLRVNEYYDPDHGRRAADLLYVFNGEIEQHLGEYGFEKLMEAVRRHAYEHLSVNTVIGACWDADRLDLPRVGINPSADLMSTDAGKLMAVNRKSFNSSILR